MKIRALVLPLLFSGIAAAQDPKPCDGKCLSPDQVDKLRKAVDELDDIHKSPATVEFQDPVVIIRDWDGRVYVNGGASQPLRLKIRVGKHVDRDMQTTIDSRVWYRPQPESPMLRLRIRAQVGVLVPEMVKTVGKDSQAFWDAGVGWDFFHLGIVNLSAFTGVRSIGAGPGIDITKNFGLYAGYSLVYDGFKSSILTTAYFSFN
jgi:hypothetical protein